MGCIKKENPRRILCIKPVYLNKVAKTPRIFPGTRRCSQTRFIRFTSTKKEEKKKNDEDKAIAKLLGADPGGGRNRPRKQGRACNMQGNHETDV